MNLRRVHDHSGLVLVGGRGLFGHEFEIFFPQIIGYVRDLKLLDTFVLVTLFLKQITVTAKALPLPFWVSKCRISIIVQCIPHQDCGIFKVIINLFGLVDDDLHVNHSMRSGDVPSC